MPHKEQNEQKQPNESLQSKFKPKPTPRLQATRRKMDLSEYDNANEDALSASNVPESAATNDERVY